MIADLVHAIGLWWLLGVAAIAAPTGNVQPVLDEGQRVIWAPQPGPQTAAILCPIEDIFFGGQRGGGKTDWLLGDFAKQASEYGQHSHGILFRRTYDELDEVVKRSRQLYNQAGWVYHEQKRTWTTPQGATLKFRYLDRDVDAGKYQGHSYTWLGFDEVGVWPSPAPLDELWATLRSAQGVKCVRRMTGNPGGVGHHWLKARYITPAPPYTPHRWQPQPETAPGLWITSVFIPSRLEDNLLLMRNDPGYEQRIAAAAQGNTALWQAWRYGNWDVVAGAAFDEWREDLHVLKHWNTPAEWEVVGGMDAGTRSPSWLGLIARGHEGDTVVTHEWYWKNKDFYTAGREVGFQMKMLPGDQFPEGFDWGRCVIWGDSSMFTDTGVGGLTQATEFQRGLVSSFGSDAAAPKLVSAATVKGPGSRRMGVALVRQMLHWETAADGSIPAHLRPRLRFHQRCKNAIRTIPALPISKKDPEDVDTEAEDHPFDGLKMALLANPPSPERHEGTAFDENRHPGLNPQGKRRRPKKPMTEAEWSNDVSRGRFNTGVRYGNGPMTPGEDV